MAEYDLTRAMEAMRAAGLDPASNASFDFAREFINDVDTVNEHGDRYYRAAARVRDQQVQGQYMAGLDAFGFGNNPGELFEVSKIKAEPAPYQATSKPEQNIDISGINDPGVLFQIAKAKGLI